MAVKRTGQLSLAEAFPGQQLSGGSSPLDRLSGLVKWYRFGKLLAPLRDGGPGRAAWPPLVLFKALLLQSLYGLSDRELEEAPGDRLLFGELNRQLEKAGVILKRGTMLDATLIDAVSAPPTAGRPSQDADARITARKGKGGITFGYKAHVGVDEGSGLIRTVITTPANVNDTVVADRLVRRREDGLGGRRL